MLQLLENYIPTIFATLTEPFWVLLTRLLSMLQPFRDLWEGNAPARKTTDATYMAVPPQLVAWKAIRSGHVVLLLTCVMVLLSNVLAVGLGALFNEAPITTSYDHTFSPVLGARFDNTSVMGLEDRFSKLRITSAHYQDHLYVALSNMTAGTRLPPWTTTDYYFQPHNLTSAQADLGNATSYSLLTRGFGARGNCTAFPEAEVPVNLPQASEPDGNSTICPDFLDATKASLRNAQRSGSSGRAHLEFVKVLTPPNIPENCEAPLLTAFGRTPNGTDANATITASFGICRPVFETAIFNVTVDPSGYVLNFTRVGKLDNTLGYAEAKTQEQYLIDVTSRSIGWSLDLWHNDTVTRDWLTHFIMLSTDSRDVLDPRKPPPDVEPLRPVIEDIYRRLFAILLSLNQHVFEDPTNSTAALASDISTGTQSYVEIRIFMDQPAFIMSMTVLALNILAASAVYFRSAAFVLPRMPSTVGSIMAYIAPSRALWSSYVQEDSTFSFGRYVGLDGRAHVGIELNPHVVPIDPKSLGLKPPWFRKIARRRRGDRKPDGPWL